MIACMGGWCQSREKCIHYLHGPAQPNPPVERLCGKLEEPEPIVIHRQKQEEPAL